MKNKENRSDVTVFSNAFLTLYLIEAGLNHANY